MTLFDLTQRTATGFKEVDIEIDERLCRKPDGSLLGAAPSPTGELWVVYLEKAVAVLCGGWDKIKGGQCTHAWKMLTGCRECYTFSNSDGLGFRAFGARNPNTDEWEQLGNSPREGFQGEWPMAWKGVVSSGLESQALSSLRRATLSAPSTMSLTARLLGTFHAMPLATPLEGLHPDAHSQQISLPSYS